MAMLSGLAFLSLQIQDQLQLSPTKMQLGRTKTTFMNLPVEREELGPFLLGVFFSDPREFEKLVWMWKICSCHLRLEASKRKELIF